MNQHLQHIIITMKHMKIFILAVFLLGSSAYAQDGDIWSLQQCIDYALEQNLTLKNSDIQVKISESNLKESREARLPNLNAGTGFGVNLGRAIDPFSNDFTTSTVRSSNISLSSSVNLFNGMRTVNTIKRNEVTLEADKLDLEQARLNLILDVTTAYLNILFNDELLQNAEEQRIVTQNQLERTKKLVDAGTLARNSLLEIEARLATDELNIVNARNTLEVSYLSLMQTLFLDPNIKFGIEKPDLNDPQVSSPSLRLNELYTAAEKTQPFIRSGDLRVESAELDYEIARGFARPTLSLSATVASGYSSAARLLTGVEQSFSEIPILIPALQDDPVTVGFPSRDPVYADSYGYFEQLGDNQRGIFSLNLSVPIYNRRQIKSGKERAQLGLVQARNQAAIQRQTLQQQIQQAYVDVNNAASSYRQLEKQVEALSLSFENSDKQFNLGVINSVDYLIAKSNLDQANNDLVRAKYSYIFRTKILDFYQGKPLGLE